MIRGIGLLSRLRECRSGVAMTEFALAAPLLMTAGLWGTEVAWLALTHLRISQTAMKIADNASRIGDTTTLEYQKIYEGDIDDVFRGADKEAGSAVDLFKHGPGDRQQPRGGAGDERPAIHSLAALPGREAVAVELWLAGQRDDDRRHGPGR